MFYVLCFMLTVPFLASAQSIVTCGTVTDANGVVSNPCTFMDFIKTVGGIVNGTVLMVSVYAAISFMYAGYAYLTSGGSQDKVSYAKGIFTKVLMGYIIILSAWALVYTIEQAFYNTDANARPGSYLNSGKPVGN